MNDLDALARENSFSRWGELNMDALVPLDAVREMCAADRCGCYGRNWACPPGCGSLNHISERLARYRSGLLVQTTGALRDDFDIERMDAISETHRVHFLNLDRQARLLAPD